MDSKIFIARIPDEPYMEISSGGSYTNPYTSTFSLRDTGRYRYDIQPLYLIILNRVVGYVRLESLGQIPGYKLELSWVNEESKFSSYIEKEVEINATNRREAIPLFVRTSVIDDLDVIVRDQYRNIIQIRLVYA